MIDQPQYEIETSVIALAIVCGVSLIGLIVWIA